MPAGSPAARPLRPTDLPVLASLWARGKLPLSGGEAATFCNEAHVWERLGLREHSLSALGGLERALRQWAPIGGDRLTWVARRGLAVRGLASARQRGRRSAWEVDHLIVASGEESTGASLLEELTRGLGRAGVEKVFIRLDAQSHVMDVARSAGFFPYLKEQLWRLEQVSQGFDCPPLPMRLRTAADLLPLFQLYNVSVPAAVRRCEALTLREWAAMQERGRCQHLVLEKDADARSGRVAAWLRLARHDGAGCFALLASRRQDAPLDSLLATAMHYLRGRRPIFCLVPEYERMLAARLADLGFQPVAEYALLANRLVRPIEEAAPVPAGAQQPYPVS
jgi:hypothetical protein